MAVEPISISDTRELMLPSNVPVTLSTLLVLLTAMVVPAERGAMVSMPEVLSAKEPQVAVFWFRLIAPVADPPPSV